MGDQDFFLSLKVVRSDLHDVNTWLKGMSRQAFGDTSSHGIVNNNPGLFFVQTVQKNLYVVAC